MSRKKTGCVEQLRKVRHMHGYHATSEELDVVVKIAQESKIDEAWFGEIIEAKARDGKTVHVVKDMERNTFLSFKFAVKTLDEGIGSPFDYVTVKQGLVFEKLLKKLGIVPANIDTTASWTARFASTSERDMFGLMKAIIDEDSEAFRFRPLEIRDCHKKGIRFLDVGNKGDWNRSVCRWYCTTYGIPFEAWYKRFGKKLLHYVYNGREFCVSEEVDERKPVMTPVDIVAANGKD